MVRVSRNLGIVASALCWTALGGCSSSDKAPPEVGVTIPGLIRFEKMYSAFDGTHDYKLTPSIPSADPASTDADPIDPASVKWDVPSAFASSEPYDSLPAGIEITVKKAGMTTITATATTKSGRKVKGQAPLQITAGTPEAWDAGNMRYNNDVTIMFQSAFGPAAGGAAGGGAAMGQCGLPITLMIPTDSSCANCHSNTSGITVEHTPQQTAGYSDDDLIQIFTTGVKPMGGTFNSPFLKNIPDPNLQACIYKSFHTWDIADDVKAGIVLKLRSIEPAAQASVDITRLFMGMRPGGAGAAGAAAPAADGAAGSGP
jgi:hypothetical protein